LAPLGQRRGELQLWRAYSREEIPALFALEFSTAIWNVGFVKRNGHIFLLTTLDKAGHGSTFQYKDHFLSCARGFTWLLADSATKRSGRTRWRSDARRHGLCLYNFPLPIRRTNGQPVSR